MKWIVLEAMDGRELLLNVSHIVAVTTATEDIKSLGGDTVVVVSNSTGYENVYLVKQSYSSIKKMLLNRESAFV